MNTKSGACNPKNGHKRAKMIRKIYKGKITSGPKALLNCLVLLEELGGTQMFLEIIAKGLYLFSWG